MQNQLENRITFVQGSKNTYTMKALIPARVDGNSLTLNIPDRVSDLNLMKNQPDFCNDFESTFSRSWVDFGSKNLSKMRGLRATFSTLLRICEKCDFEQPSHRFAIFFDFRRVDFRP